MFIFLRGCWMLVEKWSCVVQIQYIWGFLKNYNHTLGKNLSDFNIWNLLNLIGKNFPYISCLLDKVLDLFGLSEKIWKIDLVCIDPAMTTITNQFNNKLFTNKKFHKYIWVIPILRNQCIVWTHSLKLNRSGFIF